MVMKKLFSFEEYIKLLEYNVFEVKFIEIEGRYYLDNVIIEFSPLIPLGSFYIIPL